LSPDYLVSTALCDEMTQALAKEAAREAVVAAVILAPCDWKRDTMGHLPLLPLNGTPVAVWANRDEAWQSVVAGVRWAVSRCHLLVADTWLARERELAALESLETARTIAERLVEQDPKQLDWQIHLAQVHDRVGDGLIRYGEGLGALASFQAAHDIRSRLAQNNPASTTLQRDLSASYDNIGDVLRALGEKSDALVAFQQSLSIRSQLAASQPGRPDCQHDVYISHSKIGNALRAMGDTMGAIAAFRIALDIAKRLWENVGGNPQWRVDDALFSFKIATILAEGSAGERAEARALLEHARRTLTHLASASQLSHRQAIWLPAVEDFLQTLDT
jgi:tetratricopeptide (TPR) repeat protein